MADLNSDDTNSGTSTASSSNKDVPATNCTTMFNTNQPLVLELHELKKDDPVAETTTNTTTTSSQPAVTVNEIKTKKKKKRKRLFGHESKEPAKAASISSSEADIDTANKEEFYDARESYHGIAPPVQVVGSQVAAAPGLTTSLGSTIASVPSDVLEELKMTGNVERAPEHSPDEPESQGPIHKPTAPPS